MVVMYDIYHGLEGLKTISQRVRGLAETFSTGLKKLGTLEVQGLPFFNIVKVKCADSKIIVDAVYKNEINLQIVDKTIVNVTFTAASLVSEVQTMIPPGLARESPYPTHSIFNSYHTEHELLRYISRLQSRDLSLCHGELLCAITSFDSLSLQPNAASAGEYARLMVIRAYHMSRGYHHRDICIILVSVHGTNPASVALSGMKIVNVGTDAKVNINFEELRKASEANKENQATLTVTYPSTHGVYEECIDEICNIIHDNGGQVYMDGTNINAQKHYHVLFRGGNGTVAHEFIVDLRGFKNIVGIEPEDVAKCLMDYGFHGPTMSWPVPGTLMIEPTDSESKVEFDKFCDALSSIREEIAQIKKGNADVHNNVLKLTMHFFGWTFAVVRSPLLSFSPNIFWRTN
ncbi:unnamed protein product [Fraxinus pennsylvanica]|uniref:Uncharacterized protein n=1 Tax=Fraxinus pennsylvanica TaxID=56036 RepID=A0AAD2AB66_9LAMI|nr:unnamed protein product [Fraxinus pennsylvanica]